MDANTAIAILLIWAVLVTKELLTSLSNDVEFRRATAAADSKRKDNARLPPPLATWAAEDHLLLQQLEASCKATATMQAPILSKYNPTTVSITATSASTILLFLKIKIIGVATPTTTTYSLARELNSLASALNSRLQFIRDEAHDCHLLRGSIKIAAALTQSIRSSIDALTTRLDQQLAATILTSRDDLETQILRLKSLIPS